jgi:hypothetical protein
MPAALNAAIFSCCARAVSFPAAALAVLVGFFYFIYFIITPSLANEYSILLIA